MYEQFFGFHDRPFKLVPDPAYLYLSRTHQEAMAHLRYSLEAGDGFVRVTGEVGTGKTTLCRAFIERLEDYHEVAYIFSPVSDPVELLKAVNEEFGIPSDAASPRELIQALNAFLIQSARDGKQPLLIIDEAQNLTREVLEQIRLISNLETSNEKLLQIILFGQPELEHTLSSRPLRQLRQRMSLTTRLVPMTLKETTVYIEHRLRVAGKHRNGLFTTGAIRRIYEFSGGVPRLINLACDRALLAAYTREQRQVTKKIAVAALREIESSETGPSEQRKQKRRNGLLWAAGALLLMLSGAIMAASGWVPQRILQAVWPETEVAEENKPFFMEVPREDRAPAQATTGVSGGPAGVENIADAHTGDAVSPAATRSDALQALLRLWNVSDPLPEYIESLPDDDAYFRLAAGYHGFSLQALSEDWEIIERLNLPAIVVFQNPDSEKIRYLTLSGIAQDGSFAWANASSDSENLLPKTGTPGTQVFLFWRNFLSIEGVLPKESGSESVIILKLLLRDIGFHDLSIDSEYDAATRNAVMAVQEKHGLKVDGIVGPLTKIALYNEKGTYSIPTLR